MSFNKKYLPKEKELIRFLLENGSDSFWRGYVKTVDAYIGSSESMDFIHEFMEKWTSTDEQFNVLG